MTQVGLQQTCCCQDCLQDAVCRHKYFSNHHPSDMCVMVIQTVCRAHSVYFTIYPVSNYTEMQDIARHEFSEKEVCNDLEYECVCGPYHCTNEHRYEALFGKLLPWLRLWPYNHLTAQPMAEGDPCLHVPMPISCRCTAGHAEAQNMLVTGRLQHTELLLGCRSTEL